MFDRSDGSAQSGDAADAGRSVPGAARSPVEQPATSGASHLPSQSGKHQHSAEQLPEEYVTQLRRMGVRVTPQRLLVLEALAASGGHMTADALLQWAAQRYPALNLATVYRTLDLLVAHGVVAQTDLGSGVSYFELVGESPHHHLVCERCGAVGDLDAGLLAQLQQRLLETYGFHANLRHVALFGTCRVCQAASQAKAQPAHAE
ncbi:MAG TPA: transcriptional repressor [Ktedonobacterales bacterium]